MLRTFRPIAVVAMLLFSDRVEDSRSRRIDVVFFRHMLAFAQASTALAGPTATTIANARAGSGAALTRTRTFPPLMALIARRYTFRCEGGCRLGLGLLGRNRRSPPSLSRCSRVVCHSHPAQLIPAGLLLDLLFHIVSFQGPRRPLRFDLRAALLGLVSGESGKPETCHRGTPWEGEEHSRGIPAAGA